MSNAVTLFSITFAACLIAFSRPAYYRFLKRISSRTMRKLGHASDELEFVLHGLTYYVSIPTNDPAIMDSRAEDLRVIAQSNSWLFPSVQGVRVAIRTASGSEITAAYLYLKQYRAALLDKLAQEGRISEREYEWIAAADLLSPRTLERIRTHAFSEIHKQRYL